MSFSKEQTTNRINGPLTLHGLRAIAQGTSIPGEEDFLRLVDELEKNPPSNLSPEELSLMIQILRGEEPH